MNPQHEFEYWMRYDLPWKLSLSKSKQVAMDIIFERFADFVKPLAENAPDEFNLFFYALKDKIDKVMKWRCPPGHIIAAAISADADGNASLGEFPNGKPVYRLYPKEDKGSELKPDLAV